VNKLSPLQTLYEREEGTEVHLPVALAALYGRLRLPQRSDRTSVIANFATTLDGVVSLNAPGQLGGGEIPGFNPHDRMVMGLLRAVADVVIVGAGTLRAVPRHHWTPKHIYPDLVDAYDELRRGQNKTNAPLNVIVSGSGNLDLRLPVFRSDEADVLIVTTAQGARRISKQKTSSRVRVAAAARSGRLRVGPILKEVELIRKGETILLEGGPRLLSDFFAEGRLDELFLTLAPQIAGRSEGEERPGLVSGRTFAPQHPLWGSLLGVKRAGTLLFLRFAFAPTDGKGPAPKGK
jgi:riboflavin biosynthesis pyrimidine reductase